MKTLIKDHRMIPSMVILVFVTVGLLLTIGVCLYLNLDDQAHGFEVYNVKLAQDLYMPLIGTAHKSWFLSLGIDILMLFAEIAAIGLAVKILFWQNDLDDLDFYRVPKDDIRRRRLERRIADVNQIKKWSTWGFVLAGGISVFMVGTAFVTSVQGEGYAAGMLKVLSLVTGILTPFLIAGATMIWLGVFREVLFDFVIPKIEVPEAEAAAATSVNHAAGAPVRHQQQGPAKHQNAGGNAHQQHRPKHGSATGPQPAPAGASRT